MKLLDVDIPADLAARAGAGDRRAQEAFYRACARPAYALIRRIVPGPAADDLLQDAFLDAFRGLSGWDGRAPVGAWFRSVVVRRCLMHLRSPWQRSREWLDACSERFEEAAPVAPPGVRIDLERAFERLPATTRLVVWLHDVEGYTHEEIAAALRRSASFSKSQLARGHARLRAWLEPAPEAAAGGASGREGPCTPASR